MMVTKKNTGLGEGMKKLQQQFQNLDHKDPSAWPPAPQGMLFFGIALCVALLVWFSYLNDFEEQLTQAQGEEETLKEDYKFKFKKAVNLDALRKQREQVLQYVTQLEKQLPGKAEMAALLSDINQAGIGRSLQFDLFKPGQTLVKDYYAELPIDLKISGSYHDIGYFASDIANLSRIVTMSNIAISPVNKDGEVLVLDATVRTFRYLDPQEIQEQKNAKNKNAEGQ